MSIVADLLAKIDGYVASSGIAETTFGRLAVNDGKFVPRLRDGAGITVAMVDKVNAYIDAERAKAKRPGRRKAA